MYFFLVVGLMLVLVLVLVLVLRLTYWLWHSLSISHGCWFRPLAHLGLSTEIDYFCRSVEDDLSEY